jgi:hypothetical protein
MQKEIVGPGIVVYKNAIPKEWNIIERLEKSLNIAESPFKWQDARVGYFEDNKDHRNCKDFKYKREALDYADPIYKDELQLIHDQINTSLRECLNDYGRMYQVSINYIEAFNMVKYGPGEKFNVHSDDGDPYRCTVSCVGYPNDDYTGGELWFDKFDIKIKPEAGDFILCPSSFIYSHASLPVDSGIKYSVVVMTDRNEFAHRADSPVYYPVEERSKYGLS